ncbi:DctP family TRAP transporter solute-binding subunit [Alkalihalobacillus oceani]|uniref:DctP family TRAP transporter solute-binding subunit n=1 Tax=Halalkalibacter oceani TaxID=1653776 RepID=A0A9X2DS97_9BACI|nr:DctP family TRAP transporter solute-binding subunit [Halalkalibacter oceani]MCM3715230.1 DctP family TRAP transporter solute-binding subunit [Halalkalibacter oceani]
MNCSVKPFTLVLLLMMLLVACGDSESASTEEEAASGNGESITLSASSGLPASNPASQAMDLMAEKIAEYTNGTVEVDVFYDNQLGDPTTLVSNVAQGTVDIVVTGNSYFSGIVPELQVFELPFLFDSYEAARASVDGPVGEKLIAMFEGTGLKPMYFWEIGFRHLANTVRPVKEPSDLEGIVLRTLPAPVQVKTWELLGAQPTPMDFSELYTALQQGVVDGTENPFSDITSANLYEVLDYISLTAHVYTPMTLAISEQTWEKLDESQREGMMRAAEEAKEFQRHLNDEEEAVSIELLKENGVTVEENPNVEAFAEIAVDAYDEFIKSHGDELIEEIRSAQ